jgi:hypothetical protein
MYFNTTEIESAGDIIFFSQVIKELFIINFPTERKVAMETASILSTNKLSICIRCLDQNEELPEANDFAEH